MKSIVIYYSHGGNTKKVAEYLRELLSAKGAADTLELKAMDEAADFFGQCRRAFGHKKANLSPTNLDLSSYDLICFGTPVWAFGPAPAMNAYLDKVQGCQDKDAVLFTTYGSGAGNGRCLKFMQDNLANKGVKSFKQFSIQQIKVCDKQAVLLKIKEVLPL